MTIAELSQLFDDVSGLDECQAKACIYYAAGTYHLSQFNWYPILEIIGPTGTGKTTLIALQSKLCYQASVVDCDVISLPVLRDELAKAKEMTFIGEEADNCLGGRQAEALFGARCSRATSTITVKRQAEKGWSQHSLNIFGATVLHHRRSFLDQSNQNRSISIRTRFKGGTFLKLPDNLLLEMPDIPVGNPPQFKVAGRAYDTWYPLLAMANGVGDINWIDWARSRMEEASDEVKDGQSYEPEALIFARVVEVFTDPLTGKINLNSQKRANVQTEIVKPLILTLPYINPWLVSRTLKKLGLSIVRNGGTNWLYPTEETLKNAADQIGYEDDALV